MQVSKICIVSAQLCTSPPDVPNTVKKISGFSNGSLTVYACVLGFAANGEVPYISCNGTHWTNTLFACSGELIHNPSS